MNFKYDKKSRRSFLMSSTGFMLSIPFLPSLFSQEVRAQALKNNSRFVFNTYSHGGLWNSTFYPSSATESGKMSSLEIFAGGAGLPKHNIHHGNLSSLLSNIDGESKLSKALPAELNSYVNKMNLLRGIDIPIYLGHHASGNLGNIHANTNGSKSNLTSMPTIDQIMAYSDHFYDVAPAFRHLDYSGATWNFLNSSQKNGEVKRIPSSARTPSHLFDLLFGTAGNFRAEQLVVDRTLISYRRLRNNPRLSAEDRSKLDKTIEDYYELEARLAYYKSYKNDTSLRAKAGVTTDYMRNIAYRPTPADAIKAEKEFAKIYALALMTGATKVITHTSKKYMNTHNTNTDWHADAHNFSDPESQASLTSHCSNLHKSFTKTLLDELDTPEADGKTYLDNSLIYIVPESSMTHSSYNNHIVTFGSAGGSIETGKYIDFSNRENGSRVHAEYDQNRKPIDNDNLNNSGVIANRFWISILQAMGVPKVDYEIIKRAGSTKSYGDYFQDDITKVTAKYDITSIDQTLPIYFKG